MAAADTLRAMDASRGEPAASRYDELHAEAADALGFAANTLRGIRDRYRQAYIDEMARWEDLDRDLASMERAGSLRSDTGTTGHVDDLDGDVSDGGDLAAARAAEAGAADLRLRTARTDAAESTGALGRHETELSRLELAIRSLEATWLFVERGDASLVTDQDLPRLPTELQMRIVEAQEGERVRLAQEVHDGPAQALTNAIFQVEFIDRVFDTDRDMARAELRFLRELLRRELGDVRSFIGQLRPPVLEELGPRRLDRRHRRQPGGAVRREHHDRPRGAGRRPARGDPDRRPPRRPGGAAECPQARRRDERGGRHDAGRWRMGA